MTNIQATFMVPAGLVNAARNKCKAAKDDPAINLPGLDGMFTTPIIRTSDNAAASPTHFISSGWMSMEEIAYLNAQLPGPFDFVPVADEDPHALLERLGRKLKVEVL